MKTLDVMPLVDAVVDTEAIVVGTGVAGLTAALSLAPRKVTLLTKTRLGTSGSSPWAQGGVAVAFDPDDSPELHALDTTAAGAGLCDPDAVSILTGDGPERVRKLIALGASFDREPAGKLSLGREGAHARRRILHAGGDRTGAEMVRALVAAVAATPSIETLEQAFATDLALNGNQVVGVVVRIRQANNTVSTVLFRASAVVLASGGFGQLYARTTNPVENTGDGLAMAARAGAQLADLEMVQFHPTALDGRAAVPGSEAPVESEHALPGGSSPGPTLPLVTEALRGEGAWLIDQKGERFMPAIHEMAELAPRDIVARAIWQRQQGGQKVFLDCRDAVGSAFPERFPTVFESCRRFGIDPRVEPIPVTPAAHYAMAGVITDERGRTSLDGLWACGEVTATGVHGANRLASNSLLEALVYGYRVALDVAQATPQGSAGKVAESSIRIRREGVDLDPASRSKIQALAWDHLGLVRDREGLEEALAELEILGSSGPRGNSAAIFGAADGLIRDASAEEDEVRNLWTVCRMVAAAALVREESRGSHYRTDFPQSDLAWRRRLFWTYRHLEGSVGVLGPAGHVSARANSRSAKAPRPILPLQKVLDSPLPEGSMLIANREIA